MSALTVATETERNPPLLPFRVRELLSRSIQIKIAKLDGTDGLLIEWRRKQPNAVVFEVDVLDDTQSENEVLAVTEGDEKILPRFWFLKARDLPMKSYVFEGKLSGFGGFEVV